MAKVVKLVGGRKLQIKHGGGGGVFAGIGHKRLHEITSPLDHLSAAIPGRMLKADANGMPVNATNTDAQVAAAVTASHAKQHSIISTTDHTSAATNGQMLKANANGLPVDATNTDAAVAGAVSASHARLHSATSASDHSAATGADKGKYLHNDSGTGVVDWQAAPAPPTLYDSFGVVIDGGTAVPTTGSKGFRVVPYACTITGWEILADAAGDAVVDVKKSTYAAFPTTATIAGAEKPTLSTAQKNQDLTLTTWTVALAAGDILEFNLDSVATCKRVTVTLFVTRT